MPLKKEPFQNYQLDDERKEWTKRLTVRITDEENKWLEYLKDYFNVKDDATIVRLALDYFENGVRTQFPHRKSRWLFKKDRVRLREVE